MICRLFGVDEAYSRRRTSYSRTASSKLHFAFAAVCSGSCENPCCYEINSEPDSSLPSSTSFNCRGWIPASSRARSSAVRGTAEAMPRCPRQTLRPRMSSTMTTMTKIRTTAPPPIYIVTP